MITVIFRNNSNNDGQLGQAARTVTLSGFVRGTFLLPSSSNLEYYVKRDLTASGWGVNSVSIAAQSSLNNFYSVTIKINAGCSDDSQRILNGVKSFLNSFDPDNTNSPIFYDINLSVKGDTGYCFTTGSAGTGLTATKPKTTVSRRPINAGVLGVVTISASEYENQTAPQNNGDLIDTLAQSFNVSKETAIGGGLLFLLVLATRD